MRSPAPFPTTLSIAAFAAVLLLPMRAGAQRTEAHLMLAGVASVGVSVPLQFLADKHLARAVWQHNARYAAETR